MKMNHLLNTIGAAVQEAHNIIEKNSIDSFMQKYFDESIYEDGVLTYKPKMIRIEIPSSTDDGEGKVIYTPVAALVQHKNMNLDCVKLDLNISVIDDAEDHFAVSMQGAVPQNNRKTDEKNAGMLEITMKCFDTPEGIARIETQLNNLL